MKQIVKKVEEKVIDVKDITDNDFVGIIVSGDKNIIVSKLISNQYSYIRMNSNLHIIRVNYSYVSIKALLSAVKHNDAYLFDTKEEMFNWLIAD